MPDSELSPAIAVIGPANAGKTTLLHEIDRQLQARLDSVLVIKGSPDGTGRYLYYSPHLRNTPEFKAAVKGAWAGPTVEQICEWVTQGRKNLSLALLDFGGRHDEQTAAANLRMLACCTHYLVVSRHDDLEGAALWEDVGHKAGLRRAGRLRSHAAGGPQPVVLNDGGEWEASFQIGQTPKSSTNTAVMERLAQRLAALSHPRLAVPYVNLHQPSDWEPADIPSVGGRQAAIRQLASRTGVLVLGGAAPIWAYLAGLRAALPANPEARIFFYDPRQPEPLVEIPNRPALRTGNFPEGALAVHWGVREGLASLEFEIRTPDKFLPPSAAQNLSEAPPPEPPPGPRVGLYGPGPTWLFGAYARWLIAAGVQELATWDGRLARFVPVWF